MAAIDKIGEVFDVNTTTAGVQFTPSVSALHNGGFVVAWDDLNRAIIGQLYDDQGFRVGGEFGVSTFNVNAQFAPDIATLSDGTFVVTWAHEYTANDIDVRARRFAENGDPLYADDLAIATSSARDETSPHITAQDGRYLITWSQDDHLVNFIQRNADGSLVSGPGVIDPAPPSAPEGRSSVTTLVDGTYVAAFEQGDDIFQRQLVAGATGGAANPEGFGFADRPSIAALEGGGYVMVWRQGGGANDSARPYVAGQIYDALGNKVGGGFNPVSLAGVVDQTTPVVKGLPGGGFIVVWDDANLGLRALAYDHNGNTVGDLVQLTPPGAGGSLGDIDVTVLKNGDVAVVWSGADADGVGIQGQVLRVFNTVNGTNGDDRLATTLTGAASKLTPGFESSDILQGFLGDDYLQGLGGARDVLDGGPGSDTATYIDAPAPVTASLLTPAFNNGVAIGDSYVSIENLEGSFFGDQMIGNDAANILDGVDGNDALEGLAGNDILRGNRGADALDGGEGMDSFDFNNVADSTPEAQDTILQFVQGDDKIDLSSMDAEEAVEGKQDFTFAGNADTFIAPGQVRYFQSGGDTFIVATVAGDLEVDFSVKVSGLVDFAATDFVL
jgi:Ca2+-binding RTX toxin-like protein